MSYRPAVVGCMILALAVAEKGKAARAAIDGGSGRKLVLSRSAKVAGPDNDHAEAVAVAFSAHQLRVEQAGGVCGGLCAMAEFPERLRKAGVRCAISLDRGRYGFQVGQGLLLVATAGGLVPFDFQGRKVEKKHSDRYDLPRRVFSDQAHEDVVRLAHGRVGLGSVAYVDGQERQIVAQISAAKLDVGGAIRSRAAHGRTAGICRKSGSPGSVQKNKTFHELHAGCWREACKRFCIAGREELCKAGFIVGASRGQQITQGRRGSVGRSYSRAGRV